MLSCAVYALASKGKVVYIGQSALPLIRVFQHRLKTGERIKSSGRIERFPFDQIYIRPCLPKYINALEREMIQKHQPRFNIAHKYEKINIRALVEACMPPINLGVHPTQPRIERRL